MMVNEAAYLPPEIIEKILSILPVKCLLRLKGVCKSWNALISSHPFIHTHLNHFTSSPPLFIHERSFSDESSSAVQETSFVVRFDQHGEFHVDATPPNPKFTMILSSCNGVLLLRGTSRIELMLWNPSMRKIRKLRFPFRFNGHCHHVLCSDTAAADLKVVVVYRDNYAVYSCKKESWSKHQGQGHGHGAHNNSTQKSTRDMVSVDGAAYWMFRRSGVCGELVCFESDGDNMKKVHKPSDLKERDEFTLIGLRGRVCVWFCDIYLSVVRVWMREEGDVWKDFMRIEDIPEPSYLFRPYYVGENEIMVYLKDEGIVMVYHPRHKTYEQFDCPCLPRIICPTRPRTQFIRINQILSVDSLLFFDQHPRRSHRKRRRLTF